MILLKFSLNKIQHFILNLTAPPKTPFSHNVLENAESQPISHTMVMKSFAFGLYISEDVDVVVLGE